MYYERPGLSSIKPMLKKKHLTIDATVRHYLFTTEWLWNHLDPRSDGRVELILNIKTAVEYYPPSPPHPHVFAYCNICFSS